MAHLSVVVHKPRILARVALTDGREVMRLQKLAVQIEDGLQGAFFRRAQFKDRADGLRPGTQAHLRKIRMNDVHKFSRSDDAHARGGASSGQQSWRVIVQ